MELRNLQLELNMFDDTEDEKDSVKVLFLLDTILLDDTRQIKENKKPTRLRLRHFYQLKNFLVKI